MKYKFYYDKSETISFWVEEGFAFYSSIPYINHYLKKNYKVWLYLNEDLIKTDHTLLKNKNIEIVIIDNIKVPLLWKIVSHLFQIIFIDNDFSAMYKRDFKKRYPFILRLINKISPYKIKNINHRYYQVMSFFCKNSFKSRLVYAFTLISKPYLFSSKNIKLILVMESWDHVEKRPHLIKPKTFLTWNNDLINDSIRLQNYDNIKITYPSKLRYANDFNNENEDFLFNQIKSDSYRSDILKIKNNKFVLYPVCLTSIDSKIRFDEECELISSLSEAFIDDKIRLFIKPKPTGPKNDYDFLLKNKKIAVGEYAPSVEKFEMLTNEYHIYRYLLVKNVILVINLGTTFGLDAAMAGTKVLQLDLDKSVYPKNHNPHTEKYLLNSEYKIRYSGKEKFYLDKDFLKKCSEFSKSMRNWCLNINP